MDFLLSLYRISIRSKKWTLKMFDHFIDLAICNSWLEYRKDVERNTKSSKYMDLLNFRNDVANGLIAKSNHLQCSRKRGRPSAASQIGDDSGSPSTSSKKRRTIPAISVRYDGNQHWPEHVADKGRCKLEGCKGQTRYKCSKCDVLLCIPNGQKNCFKKYHYIDNAHI